ncbi:PucR family transcriptional regulator [Conexibacter sp. W3-3-2]|uniref:helix-turn-helix domain-containing protein n=1 Tax=Conexibacter sp. W3-3-2 TaxID=2675227 RepID=UPI0012B7E8EC|nr:helix-turn-helix domain-containing protein [Conexibacter sp. W3-3-2]MTD46956.1 PucR family transcriptional regulator [Conexibacter sp. W3-3-2]
MQVESNPRAAAVLRPVLPAISAEIMAALREEVPEYDRPLRGPFGDAVRLGVAQALERFADIVEDPARSQRIGREIYVGLGRGERASGRSLDALLSAYRTGARIAWRRAVEAGVAGGLDPQDLYALGEAIFAYIDELSAESADGYAQEQSREAGERSRRTRACVRALLARPPSEAEVAATAAELDWTPPARLAVVVGPADAAGALVARLQPEDLLAVLDDEVVAVVADPGAPGLEERLAAAVRPGDVLGLGSALPPAEAAASAGRARAARRLGETGHTDSPVVAADAHLPALLLRRDPALAADLAARALAPLQEETPASAQRLTATLRAWLDHQGRVETVARTLEVHPQTVRYRLARLRELLGDALDDPDGRFALQLALRATA